jgi:hypothetical protein
LDSGSSTMGTQTGYDGVLVCIIASSVVKRDGGGECGLYG